MKKSLLPIPFVVLALSGCASSVPLTAPDVTPVAKGSATTSPAASPSAPSAKMSDRGYFTKEVGQAAFEVNTKGKTIVKFVVTDIDLKLKCTGEYAGPPDNGNLVGIKMDVQTFKELNDPEYPGMTFLGGHPSSWKFISKAGTTFNGQLGTGGAGVCLGETETLPQSIGPAQKATGWIVVDLPATEGILILEGSGGVGGWEWHLDGAPNA